MWTSEVDDFYTAFGFGILFAITTCLTKIPNHNIKTDHLLSKMFLEVFVFFKVFIIDDTVVYFLKVKSVAIFGGEIKQLLVGYVFIFFRQPVINAF